MKYLWKVLVVALIIFIGASAYLVLGGFTLPWAEELMVSTSTAPSVPSTSQENDTPESEMPRSMEVASIPYSNYRISDIDGASYENYLDSETASVEIEATAGSRVLVQGFSSGTSAMSTYYVLDATTRTGVMLAFIEPVEGSTILSPDRAHLLLASETKLVVVNLKTLSWKVLLAPDRKTDLYTYGTLSGYPFFYPDVRWIDSKTVEVGMYVWGTSNEGQKPVPVEVRTLKI